MILNIRASDESRANILKSFLQNAREDQVRKYQELYLVGYNAMYSVRCQPTFRRKISPLSSGLKSTPIYACCLLIVGYFSDLLINPEDGGDVLLQNMC
jgi:hypothetical protein